MFLEEQWSLCSNAINVGAEVFSDGEFMVRNATTDEILATEKEMADLHRSYAKLNELQEQAYELLSDAPALGLVAYKPVFFTKTSISFGA